MTFIEWCLEAPEEEEIPLDVKTTSGKHYPPNTSVPRLTVECLKVLELAKEPKLIDGVWHVLLKD